MSRTPDKIFGIFAVTWLVLLLANLIFYRVASFDVKRRWHPRIMVGLGAIFLGFGAALLSNPRELFFIAPMVVLITVLNIKYTKFCPSCGSTLHARFTPLKFCQKCGASLGARD